MKPLEGITVLDMSRVIAGPHATRQLSDLGARVIKVSSTRNLDVARPGAMRKGNQDYNQEGGWMYNELNHGKLDISINLKSDAGRKIFDQLVAISDVVVCNYGVKAFEKLKLTFEDLSEIKRDIIVLNASGLGAWGPYSNFVTYAPVLQAITGISVLVGYEGDEVPIDEYAAIADYVGGLTIANYLLAALAYRDRTGAGQFIDISQGEAAAMLLGGALLDWQVNQNPPELQGNHDPYRMAAPHNTYPCRGEDAWCAIAVRSEEEWKRFCQVADPAGSWSSDSAFATQAARISNQRSLDEHITEWTSAKDRFEIAEQLQQNGVSAAPVLTACECLWEDQDLQQRDFYRQMPFPPSACTPESFLVTGVLPRVEGLGNPRTVAPAPATGADRDYVLSNILGMSKEAILEAAQAGAF